MCDAQWEFTLADLYLKFTSFPSEKSLLTAVTCNFQGNSFPDATGILNACPLRCHKFWSSFPASQGNQVGNSTEILKSKTDRTFLFTANTGTQGKQASLQTDEEEGVDFIKIWIMKWKSTYLRICMQHSPLSQVGNPREAFKMLLTLHFPQTQESKWARLSLTTLEMISLVSIFFPENDSFSWSLTSHPCDSLSPTWKNRSPTHLVLLKQFNLFWSSF